MKTEEFRFQIVTPMFLGGADQSAEGIRPASIKGALRFWWRALNWARYWQASGQNDVQALCMLHADEARLFGLAAGWDEEKKKTTGGQGVFLMQVAENKVRATAVNAKEIFPDFQNGHIYLLGLGLAKYDSGVRQTLMQRTALQKDGTFTLKLMFHPRATDDDIRQVKDAVNALGLLGALGSRARHGLGSVAHVGPDAPANRAGYVKAVQDLLSPTLLAAGEAPFSAFSARTRVDVSATGKDALKLLDTVGREQQIYRSFGRKGMVNGIKVTPNFPDDHDLVLDAINGKKPGHSPRRAVFGLPHNYYYSDGKGQAEVNYLVKGKNKDDKSRRASPLMLHIHCVNDGEYLAVHTLLPAQFLPVGEQICIEAGRSFKVPANPDWQVLHTYLNRFIGKNKGGETIHGK